MEERKMGESVKCKMENGNAAKNRRARDGIRGAEAANQEKGEESPRTGQGTDGEERE